MRDDSRDLKYRHSHTCKIRLIKNSIILNFFVMETIIKESLIYIIAFASLNDEVNKVN
jgi:hypothetical protein